MTAFYSALARLAVRRRWWILGAWLVVLVLSAAGASRAEHALKVGGFSLPGTEFHTSSKVVERDLDFSTENSALVVFHSDTLFVTDPRYYRAVTEALARLAADPHVVKAEGFYEVGIPDWVSKDNRTTVAFVKLRGTDEELQEATPRFRELIASDLLTTYFVGQGSIFFDTQRATNEDLVRVERLTLPVVFLLLVLVFGSLVAAFVPLLLGIVGVLASLAILYLLAQVMDLSIFAFNTGTMIGLGLAIDFSLMMVSRFRDELERQPLDQALERTLQTSGRSITFSGVTLILTMLVLTLFPVMVIRSIALAIVIVGIVAVLTGLLLLPAVLAVLGPRINALNLRRYIPGLNRRGSGFWYRWAMAVMRRPWTSLILALFILGLMALPALRLERRGATVQVLPESSESRQAFSLIERQFGPSEATPLIIVIEAPNEGGIWQPDIMQAVYDLHTKLAADERVLRVQSLMSIVPNPDLTYARSLSETLLNRNPDWKRIAERLVNLDPQTSNGRNTTTVLIVYPRTVDADKESVALLRDLREHRATWAPTLANTGARLLVGGSAAQHYDFDRVVYKGFPLLLMLSLLVTFFILMLFFHSLILPVKAILLNLAGILASYGILVLVFQDGHGDSLLNFTALGALISFTPVLLFSILFALSTDYEVFLLTRVREYWNQGYSDEEAVALGLDHTAGVITAAGLIMIAVFGSFALMHVIVIKELGFGLAVAVLLDTTLVRLVLVPASMKLMGSTNWWMPAWLDRLVPEIDEGGEGGAHRRVRPAAPVALTGVPLEGGIKGAQAGAWWDRSRPWAIAVPPLAAGVTMLLYYWLFDQWTNLENPLASMLAPLVGALGFLAGVAAQRIRNWLLVAVPGVVTVVLLLWTYFAPHATAEESEFRQILALLTVLAAITTVGLNLPQIVGGRIRAESRRST